MAATPVQSSLTHFQISTDGGTTKKNLVCEISGTFNLDTPVTREETLHCGSFTALGAQSGGFDFEALVNITPEATEISFEDALAIARNKTLVMVYEMNPESGTPGTDWHIAGSAYLTSIRKTKGVGALQRFSGRFEIQGDIDITA